MPVLVALISFMHGCAVNILLIVNESPWGSTLAVTALRVARSILDTGHQLEAVFFREEGVYNAVTGTAADAPTPDLARSWQDFAARGNVELLVCQSSARRRLAKPVTAPFREAGLVEVVDRIDASDRVVTL